MCFNNYVFCRQIACGCQDGSLFVVELVDDDEPTITPLSSPSHTPCEITKYALFVSILYASLDSPGTPRFLTFWVPFRPTDTSRSGISTRRTSGPSCAIPIRCDSQTWFGTLPMVWRWSLVWTLTSSISFCSCWERQPSCYQNLGFACFDCLSH